MYGQQTVLTRYDKGDAETFYFHKFCWYLPVLMHKSYICHGLGISVTAMEGFEHTYSTSKHAVQCWTNGGGNTSKQRFVCAPFIFKIGHHNIMKELERRAKSEIPETINSLDAIDLDSFIKTYLAQVKNKITMLILFVYYLIICSIGLR